MTAPVDTTVITLVPIDYGAGEYDRIVFRDCKYAVDDLGTLNVYPSGDPERIGNVATFAPGQWVSVIRGRVVALGNGPANAAATATAGQHTLTAVQS